MFANRSDAGRRLAQHLRDHSVSEPLVVLGLPRGGVPVAYEVATALGAPLDVIVVRKLGVPYQPELAMGAIGEGGVRIVNTDVVQHAGVSASQFEAVESRERAELARRAERFRGHHDRLSLAGCAALIVDDGIATGSTVRAACEVARAQGAARVIVAAPIAPPGAVHELRQVADAVIVLASPRSFGAIGQFYDDFSQTPDAEVVRLLERARARARVGADVDEEVAVDSGGVRLAGRLTVPRGAREIVLFAHGSGSSRHSERNQFVAGVLNRAGLGTLLLDLLTHTEERDRANVFDIALLGERLADTTRWLRDQPVAQQATLGYFGASTGAAAALWAASMPDSRIAAVVSRGGRPDLAGSRLGDVRAPTLLIVGSRDPEVLELNRRAAAQMHCETELEVVPGASHLFAEPGTLDRAADLARDWFVRHVASLRPR
jgi:putative phosphoribosyl transferase